MMQPRTQPKQQADGFRQPRPVESRLRPGLATLHAKALHRPVPPVYFDDDGYICEDNSPMPESETHFPILSYWHGALYARYQAQARRVCVLADLLLLVDRDVGTAAVVPDVAVAFDVDRGDRLSYKVWEEPKAPDLVLEVLSKKTWRTDVFHKPDLYADLGVKEYWIFDPRDIRRDGRALEGWRLRAGGVHEPLPLLAEGGGHSELLGLDIVPDGRNVWLRDPYTGEVLPDLARAIELREQAERARDQAERARSGETAAREAVVAENAKLREEIRKLRSGQG